MSMAPGSNIMPDSIAEKPSMVCIKIGSMTAPPIIAIKTIIPSSVDKVNTLFLNTPNSKIGSSSLF